MPQIPEPSEQLRSLFLNPPTPYGSYPFSKIFDDSTPEGMVRTIELFRNCMQEAIELHRTERYAIGEGATEPPTFENTILRYEQMGAAVEAVAGAFYNLLSTSSSDEMRALSETFSEWLSALSTDTLLDETLFARIRAVYEQRDRLELDAVDRRLLEECYEGFADNGAQLEGEDRERFRKINERLSQLTELFAQHQLYDEQSWTLFLPEAEGKERLRGVPETILADAARKASESTEHNEPGYLLDLSAPHVSAIMKHCADDSLRKLLYEAKSSVGNRDNEYNNQSVVREIVKLRGELARLLGYPTYADYKLRHRMCNTVESVQKLLDEIIKHYKPIAREEIDTIEAEAGRELEPWSLSYYMERHKEQHHNIREEELRPYFPLEAVVRGVLGLATRLYGISFRPVQDQVETYHPDVQVFAVHDEDDSLLGLLYLDFFPRRGKRSGAWMNNFREWSPNRRPQIVLVMNFTPPSEGRGALLTLTEVNTLLHEFGHALHGLLTQTRYAAHSGTNVERDFVELPSQIMENFLRQHDVVSGLLSKHYETGESIPTELLDRAIAAQRYPVGYSAIRQIIFGKIDIAYHTLRDGEVLPERLLDFEESVLQLVRLKEPNKNHTHRHLIGTSFGHIFAGGYAAGYYGYKWSELLDADAFELFLERGLFNPVVAKAFRREILERGDEGDPMELYVRFRGRRPTIDALLRRDGLNTSSPK